MADENKKTLIITGRGDGFGARYLATLSGIAYCEYKGWEYVHQPFKTLDHGVDVAQMNEFIGIPASTKARADVTHEYINAVHYAKHPDIYYTPAVLSKIRKFYYSTKKPAPCEYDIAIHIRRGDVRIDNCYRDRYIRNATYRQILTQLKANFPNHTIGIYSDGEVGDFADLQAENVHFELNSDIQKTFHALVTAKLLITSISAFSYSAALLSLGEIYYIPFWHKPLAHWKIVRAGKLETLPHFYARKSATKLVIFVDKHPRLAAIYRFALAPLRRIMRKLL